jgi:glucose-6-phosphate 1-dehydrogenase
MELKDNTVIVVLGASGDLAKKKTVSNPAIRNDYQRSQLLIFHSSLLSLGW